jgi:hypothetical protein
MDERNDSRQEKWPLSALWTGVLFGVVAGVAFWVVAIAGLANLAASTSSAD